MICLHTKFHLSGCNDSLLTAIRPKAKYKFHTAPMLLCSLVNVAYIMKTHYHAKFQNATLSCAMFTPTSEVCMSTSLIFLTRKNLCLEMGWPHENLPVGSKVIKGRQAQGCADTIRISILKE
jgi:hypothetical protein